MKRLLILFCMLTLSTTTIYAEETETALSAQATYTIEKKDPKLIKMLSAQSVSKAKFEQKSAKDKSDYQKYGKVTSGDNLKLIMIAEKLIRANNLQYRNWRIGMNLSTTEINAYATAVNLVVINTSLYDSLYNNEDALAFVIAHEMSHVLLGHLRDIENDNLLLNKYNRQYNTGYSIGSGIVMLAANYRMNQVFEEKRFREKQADVEAISLMTRAGYNPEKTLDALDFIAEMSSDYYTAKDSHPDYVTRRSYAEQELRLIDTKGLMKEGRYNLYKNNVSAIKRGSDKKTIIIEQAENCNQPKYIPESVENKVIRKAYEYYLNNDFDNSKRYFNASLKKINNENYIPALYLSYIYEYEYKQNHSDEALKEAKYWAKKAVKLSSNTYTQQQNADVMKL